MQFEIKAKVAVHQIERIVNSGENAADPAIGIGLGVHLEHLPECGIGVRTGAVPVLLRRHRDMVVQRNQFHVVLEHVHYLFQLVGVAQRKWGMESWIDMEGNPYFYGLSSHENVEIKLYNKANPLKPWKTMGRMHDKYLIADGKIYILGGRNTYNYFLGDFPGHKNFDRDVLVVCDEPQKDNSVNQLWNYFETIWEQEDCRYFHNSKKLADRQSVKKAVLELQEGYQQYFEVNKEKICDTDYADETFETEKITLLSNPIHTQAKEPVVWYQLGELMKNAKERVKIHTPYIICNDMMYNTWEEIAQKVPDFSIMTNSVANNGNPFGAADYAKNRNRILETGIDIWEYEGGYSYHGKSILIDDDLSVIGSFNMDMRSTYLDTELMLVIRSKEINKQLEDGMMEYESVSRQVLDDGTYYDPYHVKPIELTEKRKRKVFLVQHLLGWARDLF